MADNVFDPMKALEAAAGLEGIYGSQRGNLPQINDPFAQAADSLTPMAMQEAYGQAGVEAQMQRALNREDLFRMGLDNRNDIQQAGDMANNLFTGFVGGLGDVATLGAGVIHPSLGQAVAGATDSFRNTMQGLNSDEVQNARELSAMRSRLNTAENEMLFEQDKANGASDLEANLAYFGRGALGAAASLVEDPVGFESAASEGVGSLFVGGPVSKGVAALAKVGQKAVGTLAGKAGKEGLEEVAKRSWGDVASMPAAIGLQEGGGSYAQVLNEVLAMDINELMVKSPEFARLVLGGMAPEEARAQVAQSAALMAAAVVAPAAIGTGRLVSNFEAAPLARQTIGSAVGNIGRETVEEGAQGTVGQFGQNLGIQQYADNTQTLREGLGEGFGEGAVLGSVIGGVVQTPGLARQGVDTAIQSTADAIRSRLETAEAEIDNANPDAPAKLDAIAPVLRESAPAVAEAVQALNTQPAPTEEVDVAAEAEMAESLSSGSVTADLIVNQIADMGAMELPELGQTFSREGLEAFQSKMGDTLPEDRFSAMRIAANVAVDGDMSMPARLEAALFVEKNLRNMRQFFESDVPSFLENAEDSDNTKAVREYANLVNRLSTHPTLQAATKMLEELGQLESTEVTEDNAKLNASMAAVDPAKTNPQVIEALYQQADDFNFSEEEKRSISMARALHQLGQGTQEQAQEEEAAAASNFEEIRADADLSDKTKAVTVNITTGGEGSASDRVSLSQHLAKITQAWNQGNRAGAARGLEHLARMAEHLSGKVEAMNTSRVSGKAEPYLALGTWGNWGTWDSTKPLHARMDKPASRALARRIAREADLAYDTYTNIRALFPELNLREIDAPVTLDPEFYGLNDSDILEGQFEEETGKPPARKGAKKKKIVPKKLKARKIRLPRINTKGQKRPKTSHIQKPSAKRPRTIKEAVINLGGLWLGDPEAKGEIQALDYKRPGFTKKAKRERGLGGLPLDMMREALAERGFLSEDSTISDMFDALREDISGRPVYSQDDANLVAEWEAYDEALDYIWEEFSQVQGDIQAQNAAQGSLDLEDTTKPGQRKPTAPKGPRKGLKDQEIEKEEAERLKPKTMAEHFSSLVQGAANRFIQAFTRPTKPMSKLAYQDVPRNLVLARLQGKDPLGLFTGMEFPKAVTREQRKALFEYVRSGSEIEKRMTDRLKDPKAKVSRVFEDEKVLGYNDHILKNLLESPEAYNRELLQSAIIAVQEWVLNMDLKSYTETVDELAKRMGWSEEQAQEHHLFFTTGQALHFAKEDAGKAIRDYWGVRVNKKADILYSKGIPEALATEILSVMADVGQANILRESIDGKIYYQVALPDAAREEGGLIPNVGAARTLLGDMLLSTPDRAQGWTLNEPSKYVPETQIRTPLAPLTGLQKKMVRNQNKTPYKANPFTVGLMQNVSLETFVLAMGGDNTAAELLNVNHQKSAEGLNRSLVNSYRNVMAQVDVVGDSDLYYETGITSVGRAQMSGTNTPQSDKLAREIFMPNQSTLDMTTEDGQWAFWKTVAQGLGVKTEKVAASVSQAEAQQMLEGPLARLVPPLVQMLRNQREGRDLPKMDRWFKSFAEEMGKDMSMHAVQSIMAYARYQLALEDGPDALKSFEHWNYLEADGKTNGPINAVVKMSTGEFTADWVQTVGKGGLYFSNIPKTLADHMPRDKKDLYEAGTDATKVFVDALKAELSPAVLKQFNHMQNLMVRFGMDMKLNDKGELEISRGFAKNPLTVTIYGSGINGIVDKVAGALMDKIYEQASATLIARQDNPRIRFGDLLFDEGQADGAFFEALAAITGAAPFKSKEDGWLLRGRITNGLRFDRMTNEQLKNLSIQDQSALNLKANLKTFFVSPLQAGIEKTVLTHTTRTSEAMLKSTQLQSLAMRAMFKYRVLSLLAQKKKTIPGYQTAQFLTQEELDTIQKDLTNYGGAIETGRQNLFVGASTSTDSVGSAVVDGEKITLPQNWARNLTGELSSGMFVHGPGRVGVSAIPNMTISTGDGGMVLSHFSKDNTVQNAVQVFDGVNFAADTLKEAGKQINAAVFDTWTYNDFRGLSESFDRLMRSDFWNTLAAIEKAAPEIAEEFRKEASGIVEGAREAENIYTVKELQGVAGGIQNELNAIAEEIDVRQEVLRRVTVSVDQMAGTDNPFTNEGSVVILPYMSDAEVAEKLNQVRAQVLVDMALEAPAVWSEKFTTDLLPNRIKARDLEVHSSLVGPEMLAVLEANKKALPKHHMDLIRSAVAHLQASGYEIVSGSAKDIEGYIKEFYPAYTSLTDRPFKGVTVPAVKKIFLSDLNSETLAHELLHAATWDKLTTYYAGGKGLLNEDRDAIKRLESLKDQFMDLNMNGEMGDAQYAYRQAYGAIQTLDAAGHKAAAMSEFLSYTLTSGELFKTLSQTKAPVLVRLARNAIAQLKRMIFGKRAPHVADDVLSNIRFNTAVLVESGPLAPNLVEGNQDIALFHQSQDYHNPKTGQIIKEMEKLLAAQIPADTLKRNLVKARHKEALANAVLVGEAFQAAGFTMNPEEQYAFNLLVAGFAAEAAVNKAMLSRMQDFYDHVVEHISAEQFLLNDGRDRELDLIQAQAKVDALKSFSGNFRDATGRSQMVPTFIALSLVHGDFRDILRDIPRPQWSKEEGEGIDNWLNNQGTRFMDSLNAWATKDPSQNADMLSVMDAMTEQMIQSQEIAFSEIEASTQQASAKVDEWLKEKVESLGEKVVSTGEQMDGKAGAMVKLVGRMMSETGAAQVAEGVMGLLSQGKGASVLREFAAEIVGRTKDNKSVFDMISRARSVVDQTRQNFRERLPQNIKSKFRNPLTKEQWAATFYGLAKTDFMSLVHSKGMVQTLNLLKDGRTRVGEIRRLENALEALDQDLVQDWKTKAEQLAEYMVTGKAGAFLLPNAYAVARLPTLGGDTRKARQAEAILDPLISLYAFNKLGADVRGTLVNLLETEPEGMEFLASMLTGIRKDELGKDDSMQVRLNQVKGYALTAPRAGESLVLQPMSEFKKLTKMGYNFLGEYQGSFAEVGTPRMGYFHAPVSGQTKFVQGIMQTVHSNVNGIDPQSGFPVGKMNAGRIEDPELVKQITARIQRDHRSVEPLLPVFNGQGEVKAYVRSADPAMKARIDENTNLAEVLGMWRGRQIEETLADQINSELLGKLNDSYRDALKANRGDEYVDLLDPHSDLDPVLARAIGLLPRNILDDVRANYNGKLMVHRSMVNDVVGFHAATVGDFWTGTSRWNPKLQQELRTLAEAMFKNKAYTTLVNSERFIQENVLDAKLMIVIKSVVVPMANLLSNGFQLATLGVPARTLAKNMRDKTVELNTYIQRRKQEVDLDAARVAALAQGKTARAAEIERRIQALKDSYTRMSIWPLIQNGEFSAISEGGISREDLALSEGKYGSLIDSLVAKLPDGAKTPARYMLLTRDTPIFQAMATATQYGDFLAKAVLYDHLSKQKGMSEREALGEVNEEFVNYNRQAGRTRNYLEASGLIWFWNFKLRSVKVAARTLRRNPFKALMFAAMTPSLPVLGSVGSPITDNILSVMLDGRLGYSMGPEVGLNAYSLHPVWNVVS